MAYLTIDDAPSSRFAEKLDYLLAKGIPAIFFCEGRAIRGRERELVRALELGYELGNHSFSHRAFALLPFEDCRREIEETDALIAGLYAAAGRAWERRRFRFPFLDAGGSGEGAGRLQALLAELGYRGPTSQRGGFADTRCDFDQKEYWLGKPEAPDGLSEASSILGRIDALHPGAEDFILIHDHLYSHELFFACVEAYIARGLRFRLCD